MIVMKVVFETANVQAHVRDEMVEGDKQLDRAIRLHPRDDSWMSVNEARMLVSDLVEAIAAVEDATL